MVHTRSDPYRKVPAVNGGGANPRSCKGRTRAAIQATSKVLINCDVVSMETNRALNIYFCLATGGSGNRRNTDAATLVIICEKYVHKRLYSQVLFFQIIRGKILWIIKKSVIVQSARMPVCSTGDSGLNPLDRTEELDVAQWSEQLPYMQLDDSSSLSIKTM